MNNDLISKCDKNPECKSNGDKTKNLDRNSGT